MTDQEMLELAAKAAGWTYWRSKHGYLNVTDPSGKQHTCCCNGTPFDAWSGEATPEPTLADALLELNWDPLTDDGDALRLAVRLRLDVRINGYLTYVYQSSNFAESSLAELHGDDSLSATRRAIVRVAAEIGRAMEEAK